MQSGYFEKFIKQLRQQKRHHYDSTGIVTYDTTATNVNKI